MEKVENGWVLRSIDKDDPRRIRTVDELTEYIEKVGFLPLFANCVTGFSVEELTIAEYWWSGNKEYDPWEWRQIVASNRQIAYGKFFDKKGGFISRDWLPYFVNYRRDGYDFDSRWDDGKARIRNKKIMDLFDEQNPEMFSYEIKSKAGFGKDGEKNFEGMITELQMQMYLTMCDFKQKLNKNGEPYGWNIAVFTPTERVFGEEYVKSAYNETPETSFGRIYEHIRELYPDANEKSLLKMIK